MCISCNCTKNAIGNLPSKDGKPTLTKYGQYAGQGSVPLKIQTGIKNGSGAKGGK